MTATILAAVFGTIVMALWVNSAMRGRTWLRMAFFTPTILPMIAVANIWLFFYTPQIGILDNLCGLFGIPSHSWLGDPGTVLGCLMVLAIWKDAGFFMIFYLAALQGIPPELEKHLFVPFSWTKSGGTSPALSIAARIGLSKNACSPGLKNSAT